jgi:predicted DsbA family dithiol-disulfide isomerase
LESIKTEFDGGLSIQWKTFSLDQQNSEESPDFMMWEHPDHPTQGVPALVAAKAAENQGDASFLRFHLAAFQARHDEGEDIADRGVLSNIAKEAHLDSVQFERDMDKRETWQAMGEDHLESKRKYEVFGVPTLVFGQGQAVFVKLESIPESREERISLFELISDMAEKKPYLRELKRP